MGERRFDDLVEPLRRELQLHCYRMLGSVQDAEDAMQETLVRAWRGFEQYEERGQLRAWLYRIATNRCLSMIEVRRRRELPMDLTPGAPLAEVAWLEPYPDAWLPATPPGPEARYETHEAVRLAFVAALQWLPGRQRAALVLRDVLGMSARETADVLEVSVAAANSALQRARATVAAGRPERGADDVEAQELAARYAAAWERGDVDAIIAQLSSDARYAMPPLPAWYAGHAGIKDFLQSGALDLRWRFVPVRANGQAAFGTYAWQDGGWVAISVDLLAIDGEGIVEVMSFLGTEHFPRFELPLLLPHR
ncbi:sigma-70 family RNA polymerase sigma factor [Pseudonocardia sp. TRM90224]|uniref:sigma-70 family RNA polymerase sigma factor n=1 Tax=Pseudonocardia sp. TRM90224 TaxID=2812678 RepID=UPI001E633F5B|nr:sigma-70 family RNA polymerase sigma factor [Pseudonocardia sp. TRM90224]